MTPAEPGSRGSNPVLEDALRAASRGNREAFQELVAAHREEVARAVGRGMGRDLRSVVTEDDVVQDVWISAYRGVQRARFASVRSFTCWLATLVGHRISDLARRHLDTIKRRYPRLSLDETIPDGQGAALRRSHLVVGPGRSPSSLASTREQIASLKHVLDRIPPGAGDVLRLHFLKGLGVQEIAARLETTEAAIRRRLDRALLDCRKILDGEEAGPRSGDPRHGAG